MAAHPLTGRDPEGDVHEYYQHRIMLALLLVHGISTEELQAAMETGGVFLSYRGPRVIPAALPKRPKRRV